MLPSSIRKRMSLTRRTEILVLILSVLGGVLGGFAIWPYTHVATLWFEILIVGLTIGFLSEFAWIFVATTIFALCLFGLAIQQSLPPMPVEPSPAHQPHQVAESVPTVAPTFQDRRAPLYNPYGTVTFGTLELDADIRVPFAVNGEVPFELYVDRGRVYCDFNTLSDSSTAPVVIRRNGIEKLPSDWDVNSNDKAVEVVDERLRPVFQMIYETPMALQIYGVFVAGRGVFIVDHRGVSRFYFSDPELPNALRSFRLNRMFKYPGKVFPGVAN